MSVNKRAIAIALASAATIGVATVPSLGERQAVRPKASAQKHSAKDTNLVGPVNPARTLGKSQRHAAQPIDGGIAGATTSFTTCFEPPYAPGTIGGQQGWVTFPATTTGSTISNVGAPEGAQSLQLADDLALTSGALSGAETPTVGVIGPGRFTVTFTAKISGNLGADYFVDPISNTDGVILARMRFFFADSTGANDPDLTPGEILVVDDIGAGLQYVATGVEYTPGASTIYRMEIDCDANRVKYFQGTSLIYVGDCVSPASGVEAVDMYSDNFQNLAETAKFDCLSIEAANGECRGDIVRDNNTGVNDLLAVIGSWGPCPALPADCPADLNFDNAVGVNDLLVVIGGWGPCLVPTGACCLAGACSTRTYVQCAGVTGTYQGNPSTCAAVTCPPPPPTNDECANAQLITLPFSQSVNVATYTSNNASDPDTTCELVQPGSPYTKVAGWWYRYTAPTNGTLTVATCDNGVDTGDNDSVISVYTGSCGTGPTTGWTMLICDDDACNDPNPPGDPGFGASSLSVAVTAGTTYLIFIDNYQYGGSVNGNSPVSITGP